MNYLYSKLEGLDITLKMSQRVHFIRAKDALFVITPVIRSE
jgi:hypothetical protein